MALEQTYNLSNICKHKLFKLFIGNIACRYKPKPIRSILQIERINKIRILGSYNTIVIISKLHNILIRCAVLTRKVKGMVGFVSLALKDASKTLWKLSIDEELHSITATIRFTCAILAAYAKAA